MNFDLIQTLQKKEQNWLTAENQELLLKITENRFQTITEWINEEKKYPKILLAEAEPIYFLGSFLAAVAARCPIFLCNPNWKEQEWKQVKELAKPDLFISNRQIFPQHQSIISENLRDLIMIPTGGTSGKIRFAVHTWETLTASVRGVQRYFQKSSLHCFCTLPLYHVSGLMQFIRSFTTDGTLIITSFKAVETGETLNFNPSNFWISLVPTQLQRLLQNPAVIPWLSQFEIVFLGGAPPWLELLEQSRFYQIKLALTYGMTETASQIVTLKPEDFLAGNNSSGQILPHAQIDLFNERREKVEKNQPGILTIQADSLMLGYYAPNFNPESKITSFQPDDLGYWDEQHFLTLIGRNSDKIITGGENVFPAEVEAAIRATNLVQDIAILGKSDTQWGEIVVAVYVPISTEISELQLKSAIRNQLSSYKQPKLWVSVPALPRNPQGKLNREILKNLLISI